MSAGASHTATTLRRQNRDKRPDTRPTRDAQKAKWARDLETVTRHVCKQMAEVVKLQQARIEAGEIDLIQALLAAPRGETRSLEITRLKRMYDLARGDAEALRAGVIAEPWARGKDMWRNYWFDMGCKLRAEFDKHTAEVSVE